MHLPYLFDQMPLSISRREAVFSPNAMQYLPIWSCDFQYNFHGRRSSPREVNSGK